jgi:hypothetical protein
VQAYREGVNTRRSRSSTRSEPLAQPQAPVVHSITSAVQAHSDDMDTRIRRYLISMAIRTLCVILVIVVDGPVRWVFAVFAIVLPYVAVVMANAAGNRRGTGGGPVPVNHIPLPTITKGEKPVTLPTSPEQPNGHSHEQTA